MGSRIRLFEPGIIYNITHRTNDRCFLFRPNHNPKYPLLDASCPPNALDLSNDIIPVPSIINIMGSSFVRAMDAHPVDLYWCERSTNHGHDGAAEKSEEQLGEVSKFYQHANSLIARQINKLWNRQGHVFGGPYRMEPCLDNEAAEQKLEYALTNVVKDQLVESVEHSPFFSTFDCLAHGNPLRYWWINWAGYYAAGGREKKGLHPKQFLNWGELPIVTLPGWEDLTIHQRQTRVRKMNQTARDQAAEIRKNENRTVVGVPALYAVDPRDRPKNPKHSGPQPLSHAADPELRREFRRRWRDFLNEYKKSSFDYRSGHYEREFPEGSYRPPIATIYQSSRL